MPASVPTVSFDAHNILTIPLELTEQALSFCHPYDVASFSATCRLAYKIVYFPHDNYLWRRLFLFFPFDDPRKSIRPRLAKIQQTDWMAELLARMRAEMVAFRGPTQSIERKHALATFVSTVQDSLPVQPGEENKPSGNLQWLTRVLRDSGMLDTNQVAPVDAKLHAQLRSYFALTLDEGKDDKTRERLQVRRTKSRCYVYNLQNYGPDNHWGPYLHDGTVNWIHVEAIINVVSMNLRAIPPMALNDIKPPLGLEATRAYSAPGKRAPDDWAGVEGKWKRYVCFMDYRDLYAFNYANSPNGPRDPYFFEDELFREATRLIELELHLIPLEEMRTFPVKVDDCRGPFPPLCFEGTSHGLNGNHGNEASVKGVVHMTPEGVQWHFVSIHDGHTQWSSEGVQIGNVASAIGVVGCWTTAVHEPGDPVGPFWLWKVVENHSDSITDFD